MSDDTRKDPRTKFVSLNVRYKSATVDEFIENHSHDVSKGGIFIKTNSPFATGTLLKFEIRLAADEPVIAGVGRVVWKREAAQAGGGERPAGMGVKFIKVDDSSKGVIEKLVTTHADAGGAFEGGESGDGKTTEKAPTPAPAAAAAAPKPAGPVVKKTMMGLGAVAAPGAAKPAPKPAAALSKTVPQSPAAKSTEPAPAAGGFFPKTNSEADMPPPEERTMMKQAAELLEEALKEAGGSMEEVGKMPYAKPTPAPEPIAKKEPEPAKTEDELPAVVEKKAPAAEEEAPKPVAAVAQPEAKKEEPKKEEPKKEAPVTKAPEPVAAKAPEKKGSSSSTMFVGIVVVLLLAGAFGAYQMGIFGATTPAPTASATATTSAAPPVSAPVTASATPSASAAPTDSVATTTEAGTTTPDAAPATSAVPTTTATTTATIPTATVTTHVTATATATTPTATATATAPTATATATATAPTATATATTPKVPTPKPSATDSDNPY